MIFQLEGLVERTVKEKKELSDYVNNYNTLHFKTLSDYIYNNVFRSLQREYLKGFAAGAFYMIALKFVNDEAQKNQNQLFDLISILGIVVFASYTLVNVVRLIELETNCEDISKQSRECAEKIKKHPKAFFSDFWLS